MVLKRCGARFISLLNNCNFSNLKSKCIWISPCYRYNSSSYKVEEKRTDDLSNWKCKIVYNEVLYKEDFKGSTKQMQTALNTPFFFKYLSSDTDSDHIDQNSKEVEELTKTTTEAELIHFPYKSEKLVMTETGSEEKSNFEENAQSEKSEKPEYQHHNEITRIPQISQNIVLENPRRWFQSDDEAVVEASKFGSADPNIPVSNVPCGGCGALLHCTNTSVPGFMPKEVFVELTREDLLQQICQRCLFLKEYDLALGINVNTDDYPKILSHLQKMKAFVLLMVDLTDFPCSIWPNILNVIGRRHPILAVGNKVDLLIQDGTNHMKHIKECLRNELTKYGITSPNLRDVSLISAKTGYGVEKLINNIHTLLPSNTDIYIVGCTNVGKSTLFNSLIQSDLCKSQASDLIQRSTVSNWPGTTLNLLKFPILKASGWRILLRNRRLSMDYSQTKTLNNLLNIALSRKGVNNQISLMGYVGRTFRQGKCPSDIDKPFDPNEKEYLNSRWCFDTPGVVHEDQITNLLTTSELAKLVPTKVLIPRNLKLKSGHSIFIGGLARLDYVFGNLPAWFTVYASEALPVTVTKITESDEVYEYLLGTKYFAVPHGNEERLKNWPKLSFKEFNVCGMYKKVGAADIVLSSAGWITVTVNPAYKCVVKAWTPEGRGIYQRECLIKRSSSYVTSKLPGVPVYMSNIAVINPSE